MLKKINCIILINSLSQTFLFINQLKIDFLLFCLNLYI